MKKLILLFLFLPLFSFAIESKFLCSGEEIKSIKGVASSQRAYKKVIGIQVFKEGMRLNGEWFDNKNEFTDDYILKKSYLNTKDKIKGKRKFSTSSLIENKEIETIKNDKVEVNLINNNILWKHEYSRIKISGDIKEKIYEFKKDFEGICKRK